MRQFAVITADIIDSKNYTHLGSTIKSQLEQGTFPALLTPFTLSRGDELQAVCIEFSALPKLIRHLRFYCRPFKLRVGIGIGTIEDGEASSNSWDMNGPAFYMARSAMQQLAFDKEPRTCITTEDPFFTSAFNTIYNLYDCIVSGWTEQQWQAVQVYEASETFVKAAAVLSVARQNIQKRCQAAKWDRIKAAEINLSKLFQHLQEVSTGG